MTYPGLDPDSPKDVYEGEMVAGKREGTGKYTFANVPAGNYKVMAMRADPGDDVFGGLVDQQRSEQRVSVREGQEAKIDMRIGG